MKSIFTKISTLLLCGAVAMVSCTDFSEDIQNLDNKVNDLGSTTQTELASLQSAITALEAKLDAQYATKDEVAALKSTLENSIASEVAALSEDIAEVSAALNTAKSEINAAIAGLDSKKADKADVDAAVETATKAIAALQADLEATKAEIEAEIEDVKAEIAATQEELAAQIQGVDAKANELHNTLLSLSDYLKTLEAKINEVNNTLLSLAEYLPTVEAKVAELKNTLDSLSDHLAEREPVVDAKLAELQATLISLSNHLEEYEAVTDFKLVELQGSLAALSTYLEEYEASVDAKFNEILNTFESLSLFLDEKFAALDATDTDLYKEIDGIRVVLTALNNLLADETAAREAEDGAIYELIGSSVTALNNLIADLQAEDEALYVELEGVREAFTTLNNLLNDEAATREAEDAALYELIGTSVTALNNLIADLAAEDEAIYAEMENVRTYVAQVYNALSAEIEATNASLSAHIAAFEAYKAIVDDKLADLEAEDGAIYDLIGTTATALNNLIADLQAEDEAIYAEINGVRESLSQAINFLLSEDEAIKAQFEEKANEIYAEIAGVRENVSQVYNSLMAEVAELTNKILANATAIAALEDAVEMLTDWALAHQDQYDDLVQLVTKHVADLTAQIEDLQEEDGAIYDYIGKTATALNNLLDDANRTIQGLKDLCSEQQNQIGANKDAIYALNVLLDQIQADLGARLDALEVRVEKIEIDVETLKEAVAGLNETLEQAVADLKKEDKTMAATLQGLKDLCADFLNMIGENKDVNYAQAQQIAAIMTALEDINAELADNAEWQASMTTLTTQLNNAIANLWEALDLLGTSLQEDIAEAVALLTSEDAKIRAEIEAGLAEVLRLAYNNDSGVMDNVRMFEEKMSGIVDELRAAIKSLANRVQSLVYVPEYADHKATIEYAVISQYEMENDRPAEVYAEGDDEKQLPYAYVAKASDLKYLVKASDLKYLVKAENAAEVAEAIAKNWAAVLDYEVKDVKTRGASETGADLEIVNVKAEGEYIIVSVVAKNFDAKFFQKRKIGGIYSAALVLADENNTRTTEYTNLVPGTPINYVAKVLDGDNTDITWRTWDDTNTPVARLPYDHDPAERIVLEGHRLAFFAGEEINTADELIAAGYDIQLERSVYQKVLGSDEYQHHLITLKKGEVEKRQVGKFATHSINI